MIIVDNKEGLIGDFLGTIPAMQALAEEDHVTVKIRNEAEGLFDLIKYRNSYEKPIERIDNITEDEPRINLNSTEAFEISGKFNCYMTQAFMVQAGLGFPKVPPKARLKFISNGIPNVFDYCLSPFARSLPEGQKWSVEKWQELVNRRKDLKFALFGNSKYDDPEYIKGDNVTVVFDKPFNEVCSILVYSQGLISVVTGTSHLAFHLGKKNILLTSQTMAWGNNPDAVKIQKPIENITVLEVLSKL